MQTSRIVVDRLIRGKIAERVGLTESLWPETLVAWVEQGQAPDSLLATARGTGYAGGANADLPAAWASNRSRPLCAYPKLARYKGAGSLELAESFSCQ